MGSKKEGSLQFVKNYLHHFRDGKTTDEIAQIYNISRSHAYMLLSEVAERENVDRASLLRFPHAKPRPYMRSVGEGQSTIDDKIFETTFDSLVSALQLGEDLAKIVDVILKI